MNKEKMAEKKPDYKEYHGRIINQMPLLIKDGRVPISVSYVMEKRLETLTSSLLNDKWCDRRYATGDGIVYNEYTERVKIILDSQHLRELSRSKSIPFQKNPHVYFGENEAFTSIDLMDEEAYENLKGEEFSKDDAQKYLNCQPNFRRSRGHVEQFRSYVYGFTEKEVIENPIWQILARDSNLLKEYTNLIFKHSNEDLNMNFNISFWDGFGESIHSYISGSPLISPKFSKEIRQEIVKKHNSRDENGKKKYTRKELAKEYGTNTQNLSAISHEFGFYPPCMKLLTLENLLGDFGSGGYPISNISDAYNLNGEGSDTYGRNFIGGIKKN